MAVDSFTDAALVLVGHGSTVNADSAATVYQHALELRRRGVFGEVLEAFWKIEPKLDSLWSRVAARRVFVVPLFVSAGYFTEEAIPGALGLRAEGATEFARRQELGGRLIHYCRPVGTHERMTELILARARGVVARHPFPQLPKPADTALFLAGHGTERNGNSRQSVEQPAALIRARESYATVRAVFMLEEPRLEQIYELTAARNVVVVPFFMSDGLHVTEDIPVLLGEAARVVKERLAQGRPTWRNPTEKHGKRVWYSGSVGTEPGLAEVILDRVRESAGAGRR
jgi:sirohydrochlorin cobaltochelatase